MKKSLWIFALITVFLLTTSGFNDSKPAVTVGSEAPEMELTNEYGTVRLSSLKGKYVVVSFWTSGDAGSRALANACDKITRGVDPEGNKVSFLAVNLDNDTELFRQIVSADNLSEQAQYHADRAKASEIRNAYGLSGMLGTIVIDPQGQIVSTNPTSGDIARLVTAA